MPDDVDGCGAKDEFHSFTFKVPIFSREIKYLLGERVFKTCKARLNSTGSNTTDAMNAPARFWFCELIPAFIFDYLAYFAAKYNLVIKNNYLLINYLDIKSLLIYREITKN